MKSTKQEIQVDWDVIIQTIKEEKCILCIGPEVFRNEQGQLLEEQIVEFLQVEHNPDIRSFYAQDGVFLFNSEESRTHIYYKLRRFYSQSFPPTEEIFEKVARIPFHFIINLTPENLLSSVFEKLNITHKTGIYWKNRTPGDGTKIPTQKSPLIYNLFGSMEERDSLVLTYQDLFDYFDSILGARSLPQELKNVISGTDNFIFLGIPFDRWYMQLLLRIMAKYSSRDSFLRYAAGPKVEEEIKVFCQQQFRIHFIEENINGFINLLYDEMEKRGLLRVIGEKQESALEKVNGLIARAELELAIVEFREFLESCGEAAEELLDDLYVQESKFNRLRRRMLNGSIDERDAEVRQNQVVESLLELVNSARRFE